MPHLKVLFQNGARKPLLKENLDVSQA